MNRAERRLAMREARRHIGQMPRRTRQDWLARYYAWRALRRTVKAPSSASPGVTGPPGPPRFGSDGDSVGAGATGPSLDPTYRERRLAERLEDPEFRAEYERSRGPE